MENIDNTLCEALGRYYKVLEKTGYVKQGSVNQLLLLIFIQELLDNYSEFITEQDYAIIGSILECLYGSNCLIPYDQFCAPVPVTENYVDRFSILNTHYYKYIQDKT